jgi:FKBP-type peptidyl-prolyl cis-trans isomerase
MQDLEVTNRRNFVFTMMRLYAVAPLLFLSACAEEEVPVQKDPDWSQEQSIEMMSTFSSAEDQEIDMFLKRHQDWKMTETGTGLRYMIYQKSDSLDSVFVGDVVTVDFSITLLDGTECYSSTVNGPESFVVEKTDIESGLHEAVKLMCPGDRGKFILPSHLAHGLIGDTDMIPPLTPVVYDMHLLKVEKQNQ